MNSPNHTGRPFVLHEATLKQLQALKPNVAVLPWGATEAHNYHLPHGTDVVEATAVAEAGAERANAKGARCVVLPCVPFGNDNLQLRQVATITMRSRTEQLVLHDIAESLARQGIDRLVILNCHGGNDFKQMIRDVMMDVPIFIVQVMAYALAPEMKHLLKDATGDHADEWETSLMLHLKPEWVAPLETAGDGASTPSKIPLLSSTPGVWAPRDWDKLTKDTGTGNPKAATAEKGKQFLEPMYDKLAALLVQLSAAKNGDFPFIVRETW